MVSERVTVHDFRGDPMFPRIERAVAAILANGKVVVPVDVLQELDVLAPKDLEDWRFGRVPHLERVIHGSLSRLSRLLPNRGDATEIDRERFLVLVSLLAAGACAQMQPSDPAAPGPAS